MKRPMVRPLGLALMALAAAYVARDGGVLTLPDQAAVGTLMLHAGPLFLPALIALAALFTAAGGPRQAVAALLGYVLGPLTGTVLSTGAALAGAVLVYGVARRYARVQWQPRGSRSRALMDAMRTRPVLSLLTIRLLPVGSNLLTNWVAGAADIPLRGFLIGTGLGYLPQMLIFALIGSGVAVSDGVQLWLALALMALAGVLGSWLMGRTTAARLADNS